MTFRTLFFTLVLSAGTTGLPAMAQDAGEALYLNVCATCHGRTALGDGQIAEFMTVKVPGLRTLSADNDGVFPMLKIIQIIDGRTGVRGHGTEMPIWGDLFKREIVDASGEYGAEIYARGKVLALAEYLESLQDL